MAMTEKDLFTAFLKPKEAYLLFLANEKTDTTLLPKPRTNEEKALYDYCVAFASAVAERANDIDAAKDWANKTDAAVADGEYSAKYYALLAKDWASKATNKVDSDYYSAKYYAEAAALSAAAAAAAAGGSDGAGGGDT